LGCFLIGYLLALEQRRAFRRHPATFRSPGDRLQNSLNVLPFLSYGALGVSAVWPLQPCERNRVVIAVCVWLVISGCFESFVIMNPNLLEAEEDATLSNRGIKYREMRVKESPCALFEPERVIGQVVLAHEIWGVDQQCLAVAERLARSGYLTILPDLYRGLPFLLRIRWIRMSLVGSNGKMRDDILSAREWLKDQGHGDRVGGLGLSLGGTLMLRTADSGWAAIAVFYPEVARAGPLARCCPVFARFGENDKRLPDAANSLRKCLQGGGQDFDLAEVSGAGHSYMSVGESAPVLLRPLTRHWGIKPNAHAAERTWHELVGFLCRYLGEVPTVPEPSVQPVLLRDSWTDRFRAGLRRWSGRTVDKKAMNSSKYPGGD
jgi:carboxymethylenebutenolidase